MRLQPEPSENAPDQHDLGPQQPAAAPKRVLIVTTYKWAHTAKLALEFADAGCAVACLSPAAHPMCRIAVLEETCRHSAVHPVRTLLAAIRRTRPDFIIPGDDRVVGQLHRLHARLVREDGADCAVRALIERSLGASDGYPVARSRHRMQALAEQLGIRMPACGIIRGDADLVAWQARVALPWVLKTDGSSAGKGVQVVYSMAGARRCFRQLRRPPGVLRSAGLAIAGLDPLGWLGWLDRSVPVITIQQYVAGARANCAVACWQGEVLGGIAVEVVAEGYANGPSTVVRIVEGEAMLAATCRLVGNLGMTGMVGCDFIVEHETSQAYLLEANPRATPICHVQLGQGRDLVGSLSARIAAAIPRALPPMTRQGLVAYFPELWLTDPAHPALVEGYHDVPWRDPALMRALLNADTNTINRALRGVQKMFGRIFSRPGARKQDVYSLRFRRVTKA